jgi:hypothetical protein
VAEQDQDQRRECEAARRQLSEFLASVDPVWRKSFVNPKTLTPQETIRVIRERPAAVLIEYERILIQIPKEWKRYCRRQMPEYKLLKEWNLLRRLRRRGAPFKEPAKRVSATVVQAVASAEERLRKGHALRRERKRAGGAASDDTNIRPELKALRYTSEECQAILASKTLRGAAIRLVAKRRHREVSSVSSSLRRAEQAAPARPPSGK